MTEPRFQNRLARESSPYLLQHAHNPVDWYPWGDEAFERARAEDKPILLSIGYSACHWCHVMEHESFENPAIAGQMNENFVNIKVDREERPDVDQIYMSAVQMMTGGGGWPLTVFLTPDAAPFYGGTYFPPDDRYNRPGFPRVLAAIAEAYRDRRGDVQSNASTLIEQINAQSKRQAEGGSIDLALLDRARNGIASRFDPQHGGFGPAPKFPQAMTLDFLMRHHDRSGRPETLQIATLTLDRMAWGGLYDQVGGGFHRYSTDERWLVPHFEKMLYDNALLVRAYLDAYRITGRGLYRRIVEETLAFVDREMRDPGGGFYATQDADSEGEEGKFYVWSRDEFLETAGEHGEMLARYLDVTSDGNFEGQNILNVRTAPETFAETEGIDARALDARWEEARKRLFERREKRVRPGRDEKILTDWNGLMLRAFAEAAARLERDDYLETARSNAEFLLATMWDGQRLLHSFKDGEARFNAYLDDHANLADGLLALYEATFEKRWLDEAVRLAEHMIAEFWDDDAGGFFFTGTSHESLIARTKEFFDNATPAGNSVAADLLLRLGTILDRNDFREKAERICLGVVDYVERFPSGFGRLLSAADFLVGPSRELALAGKPDAFLDVVRKRYLPRLVIAAGDGAGIALLENRPAVEGKPTAYLCEAYSCRQPTTDPAALERMLEGS